MLSEFNAMMTSGVVASRFCMEPSLHDANDEKVFHSVVVVTDRRVLDQQLQNTIYQFEHKTGVVEKIEENTQQLARALSAGPRRQILLSEPLRR